MTALDFDEVSSNSVFAAGVAVLALKAKEAGGSKVTVKDPVGAAAVRRHVAGTEEVSRP
jgi:hypothetical protein